MKYIIIVLAFLANVCNDQGRKKMATERHIIVMPMVVPCWRKKFPPD